MASINVTSKTSLQELQQFANQAGGQAKIRATPNQDGSYTLYASTKKGTGVKNFMSDHRAESRQAAKDAITMVLSAVRRPDLVTAMSTVLDQLPNQGELRGTDLTAVLGQARTVRDQAAANPRSMGEIATALRTALETAALGGGNPDELAALKEELGNKIANHLQGKSRDQQLSCVMSRGDPLKEQLLQQLGAQLDRPGILNGHYNTADPSVKAFLDGVYDHAMLHLSDRRVDDNNVIINGTTYTKTQHLAKSGFGSIDVYQAASGEKIAIKTPILGKGEQPSDKFDEAAKELTAHRSATTGNPANVIGLKGALRTPDGMLQIALEYAPRGNAFDMIDKLRTAVTNGQITPQEANLARLTLLKDMIEGVRHVQETRGMVHLDIKSPNFFVDAGGVVKLGDFGTAESGNVRQLRGNPIDNPIWSSPELIKGGREFNSKVKAVSDMNRAAQKSAIAQLEKSLSPQDRDLALQNIKAKFDARTDHYRATTTPNTVTGKTDTWSLGIDAYNMFFNAFPFDKPFMSEIQDELIAFASNPNNRVHVPNGVDIGMTPTQLGQLDNLLGQMLHPDPTQRPTLTNLLADPLFQQPGVGGPQARALIQQLT